jgi:hypothetical protein
VTGRHVELAFEVGSDEFEAAFTAALALRAVADAAAVWSFSRRTGTSPREASMLP